ncbi:MAG TPA: solute:sodium symporter family transporter [Opitutae bacterium]|nr:solute:sodium symporter family transporter [Opitutaceae bacterium]HCR28733.1 solute:sodium symporter family transporter [Opitutae bacterium]
MLAATTCIGFMAFVAWYSLRKTRGHISSAGGYFLAGRGLTGLFIGGSLLLSNISTEQLIGQNGLTYAGNMTALAWEVWAVRGIILLAVLFLPMYLGGAFATMPTFLKSRYGEGTGRLVSCLLMFGYIFIWSPSVLYGGSLALMKALDIQASTGWSQTQTLWIVTWTIGIIGAIYAIGGGLRAVAISDTLNGFGLLVVGCLLPIFGLMALGEKLGGGIGTALVEITTTRAEKLNAIGTGHELDAIPISAVFTGLMVMAVFYWGTNQFIIQRALGAANLKEGQKGLLLAGFFKMLIPFMAMFPGLIAFHLFGPDLNPSDMAYPALIEAALPKPLLGLFIAVLLGAVFSTYNSLLNSAATMFAFDLYKPIFDKEADDIQLIRVSKIFAVAIAMITLFMAPSLVNAPDGLFIFINKFAGFIAIPIACLVIFGLFANSLRIPPRAAQFVIVFHIATYYTLVWGLESFGYEIPIHWMHVFTILFLLESAILVGWSVLKPHSEPYQRIHNPKVEMKPWKFAMLISAVLLSCATMTFVIFSKPGLAYSEGIVSPQFGYWFTSTLILCVLFCLWAHRWLQPRYASYVERRYGTAIQPATDSSRLSSN